MADVFESVKKIVIDRLSVDESKVTMEASFKEDLGADSLDVVELVMELEDEFDLERVRGKRKKRKEKKRNKRKR